MTDHGKAMNKAYAVATKELRRRHSDEFHAILEGVYADMGLSVRKRLTGVRKRQADIEKAKAILANIETA